MSSKSNRNNPFGPPPSIFDDTTSTPPPLPFNTTDHLFNQNSHPLAASLPNLDSQSPSSRSGSIYSPSPIHTQLHSPKDNPNGTNQTNVNLDKNSKSNTNTNPSSIPTHPTIPDNNSSENTSPASKDNETNDTNDTEEDWGAPPTSEQEPMLPHTTIPTSTPTPKVRVSRFATSKIKLHSKVSRSSPINPILSHSIITNQNRAPYPRRRQYPLRHGSTSNIRPDGNTVSYSNSNSNLYISPNPNNDIHINAEDFGAPPPNATEPLLVPSTPNSSTTMNASYTSNCYTAFNRNGYRGNHGEYGFGQKMMMKRYEYNPRDFRGHSEYSGDRKRKRSPSSCYLRYDIMILI